MFGCDFNLILTSASVTAESLPKQKTHTHFHLQIQCERIRACGEQRVCYFVCVFVCTHVESGSLSLLPRPGILKAFARLFFPPSGAKAVMYSSKPTRAADNRQYEENKTHLENMHTQKYMHRGTLKKLSHSLAGVFCHWELLRLRNIVLSVGVHISVVLQAAQVVCLCFNVTPSANKPKVPPSELPVPGLSLPVPFCSANFWMRLSMPMFSTFCLNSS